jgi:hypothetical protein
VFTELFHQRFLAGVRQHHCNLVFSKICPQKEFVMVRVRLSFVPPGGGEVDYGLTMDMPALPRAGDYISVSREPWKDIDPDRVGSEDFIVRRVWWLCQYPDDGKGTHVVGQEPVGIAEACAECEFAIGPYSSVAHKRAASTGKSRSKPQEFEATNY